MTLECPIERQVCLDKFRPCKSLGMFAIKDGGHNVGCKIVEPKDAGEAITSQPHSIG